ncbi:MAG: hypothetical protein ACOC3V_04265 [bacterium]
MDLNKVNKAYEEILSLLQKHKDLILFDIKDLEEKAKVHLFALDLKYKYGLNIDTSIIYYIGWNSIGPYATIGQWGEKYNRVISWSDDDSQPEDEFLLQISFPTGPLIFGDDYPVELFKRFFDELKSYGPKYTDTHNSSLYFSLDNAKDVFNSFNSILDKYIDEYKNKAKENEIKNLKERLANLENN